MLHPDLATMLAHDHLAELHAEAARTRLIRRLTRIRPRRRVIAEPVPPALSLVAAPPREPGGAASDPARVA